MWREVCFCVVASVVIVSAQDPTVTIARTEPPTIRNVLVQGFRDHDVTMDCYVENLIDTGSVRWQRIYTQGGVLKTKALSQDMALEDNIHYSIEKPTPFTWRLRIRTVQVEDNGLYMCFVQVTLNSRVFSNRTLDVVFAPIFDLQQTSPDMNVDAGDTLDFICNASAVPIPIIVWTRLGNQLLPIGQEKYQHSRMHIAQVRPGDRGIYRCTAMNSVGEVYVDINVNVYYKPIVTTSDSTVYQAVGYRIELQCMADANPMPSASDVSWVYGTTTYTTDSDRVEINFLQGAFGRVFYELILTNVQPQDFGVWTCRFKYPGTGGNPPGTSIGQITLSQSDEPQASTKMGRVISAADGHVPVVTLCLLSVLAVLMSLLITC